jgi:hypothetical protein
MNRHSADQQVQTLGTCLSQLRAGDPCPCCGALLSMRLSSQRRRSVLPVAIPDVSDDIVLSCPECGCEISAEDGADHVRGHRPLSVAA